ncbi:D-Ala-D-Ala carboxypeptidase family metallohydrolase [Roseateles depolymerans]|uniref:Uncharacterized protein n=1 Tax=Roseateles depolymerans TaxID=76731 RepID=A0A0U3CDC0_9BURK|nr:D-Ala-D-Ala carboxypeptidase family metallohydrolase [Roseateles depolymerans]ALV06712.1 hypothetical protein RD2015_2240 [Roseateles depolymerans]REG19689.1 peptidase M15-like protein [Roseateles depolymerans]
MITLDDYFMGRREKYPAALTTEIERNAARTVDLANKLLTEAQSYGVTVDQHPANHSTVSSGWRPPEVNAATPNSAARSKHMTGQAIDIYDPDGDLDEWLMTGQGQAVLSALGLWMEHPSATKGWCHVQTVPPGSGRRVFYP